MADQLQTPPASVPPGAETPTESSTALPAGVSFVSSTREPARSWEHQLKLDRDAMVKKVGSKIRVKAKLEAEKWALWSMEARRNYFGQEIQAELEKREKGSATTTARAEYPERWQKECEQVVQNWISALENIKIAAPRTFAACNADGIDRDDDEELPPKRFKVEQSPDAIQATSNKNNVLTRGDKARRPKSAYLSDDESTLSDASSSEEDESEDESEVDQMPSKSNHKRGELVVSTMCSRSLAIKLGITGFSKATLSAINQGGATSVKTECSTNGNKMGGATRRHWEADEYGRLREWPPW